MGVLGRDRETFEQSQDLHASILGEPSASAIRAELERVLASHHFETSRRCQAFLRYTVEQTLAGKGELKERVIGIEVFDRNPTYDTNQDPVVRMTAGEIRKRLALYYQEAGTGTSVRLELPVGAYVPRFSVNRASGKTHAPALVPELPPPAFEEHLEQPAEETRPASPPPQPRLTSRGWLFAPWVTLCLLAAASSFWYITHRRQSAPQSAVDQLWQPILAADGPVLISIGQIMPTSAEVRPNYQRSAVKGPLSLNSKDGYPREIAVTVFADSIVMTDIAALLTVRNKPYAIRPELETTFSDLQNNTAVLIGAFDNDWTINLTNPLRFHFSVDPSGHQTWIADREHPDAKIGFLPIGTQILTLKEDYGVVVRMYDKRTMKMVLIVAGLTPFATQAGGYLVTDPAYIADFARSAPADWSRKNMEILYRTDMIDGKTGPPQTVATTFW